MSWKRFLFVIGGTLLAAVILFFVVRSQQNDQPTGSVATEATPAPMGEEEPGLPRPSETATLSQDQIAQATNLLATGTAVSLATAEANATLVEATVSFRLTEVALMTPSPTWNALTPTPTATPTLTPTATPTPTVAATTTPTGMVIWVSEDIAMEMLQAELSDAFPNATIVMENNCNNFINKDGYPDVIIIDHTANEDTLTVGPSCAITLETQYSNTKLIAVSGADVADQYQGRTIFVRNNKKESFGNVIDAIKD